MCARPRPLPHLQVWLVIAPYVDTKYISSMVFPSVNPLDEYTPRFFVSTDLRDWIGNWSKALMGCFPPKTVRSFLTSVPARAWACRSPPRQEPLCVLWPLLVAVMQTPFWDAVKLLYPDDISSATFLLPYLLRDALHMVPGVVGPMARLVLSEVVAVLSDGAMCVRSVPGASVGASEVMVVPVAQARAGPTPGTSAVSQTPRYSGGRAVSSRRGVGFLHRARQAVFSNLDTLAAWEAASPSGARAGSGGGEARSPVLWLLNSIPQRMLAEAAVACDAHARALRHLEGFLRAADPALAPPRGMRFPALDSPLPRFPRRDLTLLQSVYSKLGEPDGLTGVLAMRHASEDGGGGDAGMGGGGSSGGSGAPSMPLEEQIVDCEHDGRWAEALVCFEQAILRRSQARSTDGEGDGPWAGLGARPADCTGRGGGVTGTSEDPYSGEAEVDDARLHSGILRCLHNTGHLDTALQRAMGVMSQRPDLVPAVTPYAVEAAWKLGQWSTLRAVLHGVPGSASAAAGAGVYAPQLGLHGVVDAAAGSAAAVATAARPQVQDFETLFADAMLALHDAPAGSDAFRSRLKVCRFNVMASLAAASMESYNR